MERWRRQWREGGQAGVFSKGSQCPASPATGTAPQACAGRPGTRSGRH
ncbi:hypothetical protein OG928_04965 [Embleya sp. NBC_00896]|nr:hypothetical protein OG928_04965 [Embleya sp. NBC_00896]